MQYLLTIYVDESAFADATPEEGMADDGRLRRPHGELKEAGVFLGGEGLQPTATATTVRVRDGEPLLTDGPFAETREQLAGFYLLECADLDEAVALGARRSRAPRAARSRSARSSTTRTERARLGRPRSGGARLRPRCASCC